MRLEALRLRQWRVFEDETIDFTDGMVAVRGQNGAGKSTIAEAIGWALFGKLRAGKLNDVVRQDAPAGQRASVTLTFRIGATRYRIERVAGGSAKFWIGDGDEPETSQTTQTNARIAEELDLTWDLYRRTVYAQQKDVAALDPSASKDARRTHVERLLGLGRLRDAATRANEERKRVDAELKGLREGATDLRELEEQLSQAEAAVAAEDPAVQQATAELETAEETSAKAAENLDAAKDRRARDAELERRIADLSDQRDKAATQCERAAAQCTDRDKAHERRDEIAAEAAGASAASKALETWGRLADAAAELADAERAVGALGFEEDAAKARTFELKAAVRDLERLAIPDSLQALDARLAALQEVSATGDAELADEAKAVASRACRKAASAAERLAAQLDAEREHLEVLRSGDDACCPVCLRPFEEDRSALEAEHERRVSELEEQLGAAEAGRAAAEATLEQAAEAADRARNAAKQLAKTEGASTVKAAEQALAKTREQHATATSRDTELRARITELQPLVERDQEQRAEWAAADAAVSVSRREATKHLTALGVESHDKQAHADARHTAERLNALAEELREIDAELKALAACDERAQEAADELSSLEQRLDEAQTARTELSFDAEQLEGAKAACDEAAAAVMTAREKAQAAKITAAGAAGQLAPLRESVDRARAQAGEISAREADLRAHTVAHEALVKFRDAQAARAWPVLEQTAGLYLNQATDGRYSDVRIIKDDFKFVIVDGGQEHGFERFSGGEQDLANLCVRLAIADWVAREREARIGFVILDEVFGSQDEDRRRLLVDQLRRLSERFHQMLVITHVPEIAEQCDSIITVEQPEDGRSIIAT